MKSPGKGFHSHAPMQEYDPIVYEDSSLQGNTHLPHTPAPLTEGNPAGMKKRSPAFH